MSGIHLIKLISNIPESREKKVALSSKSKTVSITLLPALYFVPIVVLIEIHTVYTPRFLLPSSRFTAAPNREYPSIH